jgi:LPS-assembly lipoprotein
MTKLGLTGLTLALTALLAACGFQPLYGGHGANPGASQIFSSIYVDTIESDAGYELRNALIDLLDATDRPANPRYSLKITLKDQLQGAALQNDATITRYNYTLTADYALLDSATGKPVTSGEVSSLNAYNVVASPYATLVAQKDAQRRAGDDLAERIRLDLGVYFAKASGVTR